MAKRETKETYKQSKELGEQARASYQPLSEEAGARAGALAPGIGEQKDYLTGQYKGMLENGPSRVSFGGGISAPGKVDVTELRNTLEGYKGFRDTGGLSGENIERMRGMGGYDEFARTGGYTPEAIANIKAQAISPIGSYATGTRDELARRSALQSGYAPGYDAANRTLQRDTSRAIADTSLNANVMLQDRINAGRQWGIGGLTSAEQALAGMQTGNRLTALGGEGSVSNAISGYNAADIQNAMQAQAINSQLAAQEAQLNASRQDAYKQMAMGGLGNLYGTDIGLQQGEYDRQKALMDSMNQASQGYLGTQSDLAKQPGFGGNLVSGLGAAAGIASSMMAPGAGAAMGGLYQGPSQITSQGVSKGYGWPYQ